MTIVVGFRPRATGSDEADGVLSGDGGTGLGAGHFVYYEQPELANSETTEFFSKL